jgi:hypothetical protein
MVATTELAQAEVLIDSSLEAIKFDMLRLKLMDHDEGAGWSVDLCDQVETEYRRYLALSRHYGTRSLVPSQLVDTFWHYHILDTQAYVEDCQNFFGYYFHHFPYFGMRGQSDRHALYDAYEETLRVYQNHFGQAPQHIWPVEGMSRCPKCGRG